MNIPEYAAKSLLEDAGIQVPAGIVADSPQGAARAAARLGPVMIKAQVPMGGRGKSGGIRPADTPIEARAAAAELIGSRLGRHRVAEVLVPDRDLRQFPGVLELVERPSERGHHLVHSLLIGVGEIGHRRPLPLHEHPHGIDRVRRGDRGGPFLTGHIWILIVEQNTTLAYVFGSG